MLVKRIENELCENDKEKSTMFITKCWNIIRTIGETKIFFPAIQDNLEQALLPLFKYMEQPELIEFDDDIVHIMNSMMMYSHRVSDVTWILVQTFPKIFVKYDKMLGLLFQSLNLIMVYGNEKLANYPNMLDMVNHHTCPAFNEINP